MLTSKFMNLPRTDSPFNFEVITPSCLGCGCLDGGEFCIYIFVLMCVCVCVCVCVCEREREFFFFF